MQGKYYLQSTENLPRFIFCTLFSLFFAFIFITSPCLGTVPNGSDMILIEYPECWDAGTRRIMDIHAQEAGYEVVKPLGRKSSIGFLIKRSTPLYQTRSTNFPLAMHTGTNRGGQIIGLRTYGCIIEVGGANFDHCCGAGDTKIFPHTIDEVAKLAGCDRILVDPEIAGSYAKDGEYAKKWHLKAPASKDGKVYWINRNEIFGMNRRKPGELPKFCPSVVAVQNGPGRIPLPVISAPEVPGAKVPACPQTAFLKGLCLNFAGGLGGDMMETALTGEEETTGVGKHLGGFLTVAAYEKLMRKVRFTTSLVSAGESEIAMQTLGPGSPCYDGFTAPLAAVVDICNGDIKTFPVTCALAEDVGCHWTGVANRHIIPPSQKVFDAGLSVGNALSGPCNSFGECVSRNATNFFINCRLIPESQRK